MSKLITVFGATGSQGGSVVRAILNHPVLSTQYRVRGITRDTSKSAAQELAARGVEVVSADMSTPELAAPAVAGADAVFFVTNYWERADGNVEVAQGKAVADACKTAGVKQLIFSSLINTTKASSGRLSQIKHFDGKAEIEEYIRASGVPATFVLPGFYMSNLFTMLRKDESGEWKWVLPVSGDKARVPVLDVVDDYGKFVAAAVHHYPKTLGKRIYAAAGYPSPNQMVADFAEATGKKASFVQVPKDAFKANMPPAIAEEMTENMLLLEDPGYYGGADLTESLEFLHEKPISWKEFVAKSKDSNWQ